MTGKIVQWFYPAVYDTHGFRNASNFIVVIINAIDSGFNLAIILFILMQAVTIVFIITRDKTEEGTYDEERNLTIANAGDFGTAHLWTREDIERVCEIKPLEQTTGIILGKDSETGYAISLKQDATPNYNMYICGASGSKKTVTQIIPQMYQSIARNESFIVVDTKGITYKAAYSVVSQFDYDVKVFNLKWPEHSDSIDFLSVIRGDPLRANTFTETIMEASRKENEVPFWFNGEAALLNAVSLYISMDETRSANEKSLGALYDLITTTPSSTLDGMFERLPNHHPAKMAYADIAKEKREDVKDSWASGLARRLAIFKSPAIRKMTTTNDIDFTAPGKKKCAYFIIIDDQDRSKDMLATLYFSFFFQLCIEYADSQPDEKCEVPVNVLLDEFPAICKINNIQTVLSTVRSRDIKVTLVFQDIPIIRNKLGSDPLESCLGNCAIGVYLGSNDPVTQMRISEESGDTTAITESKTTDKEGNVSTNVKYSPRKVLTPSEAGAISKEEVDMELVRVQNMTSFMKIEKIGYWEHPLYKYAEPINVSEYIPARDRQDSASNEAAGSDKWNKIKKQNNGNEQSKGNEQPNSNEQPKGNEQDQTNEERPINKKPKIPITNPKPIYNPLGKIGDNNEPEKTSNKIPKGY